MKRILVLLTVAAMMALGVAGQAWADPSLNADNCAGVFASESSPETINKGQWRDRIQTAVPNQQVDELSQDTAERGNCGENWPR
jgi:hypothetical protein